MEEQIKLLTYNDTLATRKQGLDIRLQLLKKLNDPNCSSVVLDFEGVALVTHGFIDELVGKLVEDYNSITLRAKLRFKSIDKHRSVINYVIEDRWKNID